MKQRWQVGNCRHWLFLFLAPIFCGCTHLPSIREIPSTNLRSERRSPRKQKTRPSGPSQFGFNEAITDGLNLAQKHKTAITVHQDDFTKLEAALLLPLARIISDDVVASEESQRVDSEAIQGPIAVSGNEHEPVRAVFFQ
jgi:hypothetical protein